MHPAFRFFSTALLAFTFAFALPLARAADAKKIDVLIITGGHGFTKEPFFRIFRENPEVNFTTLAHTKDADAYESPAFAAAEVVILYDLPLTITPVQREKFLARIAQGGGLFVLHHALCSFPDWPDYERIIGGRYPVNQPPVAPGAVAPPPVGYKHGVEIPVVIVDRNHPITAGMHDFTVQDEIYWGYRVAPDVTPLVRTTNPESGNPLAWCRTEGKSRVVVLQLGHGLPCYDDVNYRTLVAGCIRWAARR